MMNKNTMPISIFWFRRDLRLEDNTGLFQALNHEFQVLPVFIFDSNILDQLENRKDKRVTFIHTALSEMQKQLKSFGSGMKIMYGTPEDSFQQLSKEFNIGAVFTNQDYESYAIQRDDRIKSILGEKSIPMYGFKDQVIFEKDEIMSNTGTPYTVFTPYSKKWKAQFKVEMAKPFPTESLFGKYLVWPAPELIELQEMNFERDPNPFPPNQVSTDLIAHYEQNRNFPALPGTSKLSVHLRFGTISIRSLVSRALAHSEIWLNELIWREFYMNILWHFPQVAAGKCFKPAYENIQWRNNEKEFNAWCEGKTGYPIVDAGMRELNETGFMHNRVRMITASFLVKHLLIDWRWGEAYFAEKLLDFDFSANNGGWQWAAGSGCDAAPYFRVFNPTLQTEKFDKKLEYIKKWVPEYNDLSYIQNQIVNHEFARKRVLDVYKKALNTIE